MTPERILAWAETHGEMMPDDHGRRAFRCSAHLIDGTFLPCVMLREAATHVAVTAALLGRRDAPDFDELYPSLIQALATGGNRVETSLLGTLEPCRYAIPWEILSTLPGEIDFSPLAFAATMDDGKTFTFATAYAVAFFEMPSGYSGSRVRSVVVIEDAVAAAHREKPAFVSFVDGVDFGAARGEARKSFNS